MEAYQLGALRDVIRPSLLSWAVGILPAIGWFLALTAGGVAMGLGLVSEPFAFVLNLGWAAFVFPVAFPIGGLYFLIRHLARNQWGQILVLDDGVVIVTGRRGSATVFPWAAVRCVLDGKRTPGSQVMSRSANVFAHGKDQFTARMTDGTSWVFGSDLKGYSGLREWFRQKVKHVL